jgi:hypothetical protein
MCDYNDALYLSLLVSDDDKFCFPCHYIAVKALNDRSFHIDSIFRSCGVWETDRMRY